MTQPFPADSLDQRMAFSVDEVCAMLGMSAPTVYARIKDGSLRSAKLGNRRLILRKDVEALFSNQSMVLSMDRPREKPNS